MIGRRIFVLGAAALAAGCTGYPDERRRARADFRSLAASLGAGGRLGLAALDTGTGRGLVHDEQSRYALCSTFKLPLAAAIMAGAESGRWSIADEIQFGPADLLEYAPVVRANLARGRLTIAELCSAILEVSDNSAANLLLRRLGGPAALTAFIRGCGDAVTRLDRIEPDLGTNLPGDPRDTTTPAAMLALMQALLFGEILSRSVRDRLIAGMVRGTTGRERLRAGLPADWRVGDKTGNGANGAANDIAFAIPPGRAPILIACYLSGGTADRARRDAVHAAVARAVASAFV